MESVGDLVIVVDNILPFLANVYLHNKGNKSTQHINTIEILENGNGKLQRLQMGALSGITMPNRR